MAEPKLKELIETLKRQGVETGEEASRKIIGEAQAKAQEILSSARAEAESILEQARREAEKRMMQLQSSMEIAASQFVTNLKRVIEENLLVLPMKKSLTDILGNTEFLKDLLKILVAEFIRRPDRKDIVLLLPSEQQERLKDFALTLVPSEAPKKEALRLTLQSDHVEFGFLVDEKDGTVRLDFTDEAFLALFLRFLSPKFRELFKTIKIGEAQGR